MVLPPAPPTMDQILSNVNLADPEIDRLLAANDYQGALRIFNGLHISLAREPYKKRKAKEIKQAADLAWANAPAAEKQLRGTGTFLGDHLRNVATTFRLYEPGPAATPQTMAAYQVSHDSGLKSYLW